ncbi:MAG: ubiquinone biosynthesis protein, partial [Bacteroidetes bacterium 4572_117]
MLQINQTVKNITRLSQVINTLLKYSFEDIISNTGLKRFVPAKRQISWKRQDKSVFEYTRWERVRMVIEELGPSFIKLAQLLSNRPDILPEELIYEFSKLQSQVLPFDLEQSKSIVERETGKTINEVFTYFDTRTIGSASIGQAHRARLKNGTDVVVKVQRPDAYSKVTTDIALLKDFVRLTENYFKNLGILNPKEIVEVFEKTMLNELDYEIEARNIQHFRQIFKNEKKVKIPQLFKKYSTSKILTTEFISGCKITDIEQIKAWGVNPAKLIKAGMENYFSQIFEFGFFHADPHPGNILVSPDGKIALIDFGMVGKLTKREKHDFSAFFIAMANQQPKIMANHMQRLAGNTEIQNISFLEKELEDLVDEFVTYDFENRKLDELTSRLRKIVFDFKMSIPGSIFLLLRTLAILEGIGRVIDPEMKIVEVARPYGFKLFKEKYSPKNLNYEFQYAISNIFSLLYSSPIDLKFILKKIKNGKIYSHIELHGLENFLKRIDINTNKFVLTFIFAALFVSGALMTNIPPERMSTFFELPWISLLSFVLSAFFGFVLAIYLIRNRNS